MRRLCPTCVDQFAPSNSATGSVARVVEWFGYNLAWPARCRRYLLHILVDAKHEVALSYTVTNAHGDDAEQFLATVEQAKTNLPKGRS